MRSDPLRREDGSAPDEPDRSTGPAGARPSGRFVGIDVGAETIKVVELVPAGQGLAWARRALVEHGKRPGPRLLDVLRDWDWPAVEGAAVSGRLSRQVALLRVPTKQAQARGYRYLFGHEPATVVSIGNHGFSVLELRPNGLEVFRENNRCSQGTGNFLRQLVERFSLSVHEASELAAQAPVAAPLSGRCPVILKTDMTHLANKGEDRAHVLAGLFDAVCENVLMLIKPGSDASRVYLIGGVSCSRRVQRTLGQALEKLGLTLMPLDGDTALFFEALGDAVVASENPAALPPLEHLLAPPPEVRVVGVAPLSRSLRLVQRMERAPLSSGNGHAGDLILGFDIGSTGSKLVALDAGSDDVVWEGYGRTGGDPVGAAQALLRAFVDGGPRPSRVRGLGVTGSGREIVGSLMATCYGKDAVFILNEIAAHAEGALHYDRRVDTIFEIGGQDAKYIRLAGGRVIDCAMNEACSAGTGSFIEEQGRKFAGIRDVTQMGQEALAAPRGVSLGQHCSVFMAEIIDESTAAGVQRGEIIAGLYDSIVQNYLHRVKGNRSVGGVIFCQGMPFSADALAAAVARETASAVVVPPNPGTVGALGIALLARRELAWRGGEPLDAPLFLDARVEAKETFICRSTIGCGGAGNRCGIDSLRTVVSGERRRFTWGGACSLHDKGTRTKKLPDRAPDPFREREEWVQDLLRSYTERRGRPSVALADEFMLKGLLPFFATFLHELGLGLIVPPGADRAALGRGIQQANVLFCAPMQLYHGLVGQMAEAPSDFVFVPVIRSAPRVGTETAASICPIVQAAGDIVRLDVEGELRGRLVSPVVDFGPGDLDSPEFLASCQGVARAFGVSGGAWRRAHQVAAEAQRRFEEQCLAIGQQALRFCAERDLVPVVVLGRPYTIYNRALNSNVPALLREQGAMAIPVDCYPVGAQVPTFDDVYWGYSQRILRAAHQVRRTPGVYSLFCSNYACGPDSFTLHFYGYIMEGKPFAIIETDGHAGDAGTKTRVEAFLHCVEQERKGGAGLAPPNDFRRLEIGDLRLADVRLDGSLLMPNMGPGAEVATACLRGMGLRVEALPPPDEESLRLGRRHTSGKECTPMCMTLGTLLRRLEREPQSDSRFTYVMPRTRGPCRFGVYNVLNRLTLERLGRGDRVRFWSPRDSGYFEGTPPGFAALVFTGFMASDLLLEALLEARPAETVPGAAREVYDRYVAELLASLETRAGGDLSVGATLWQVANNRLFGVTDLLRRAAAEFSAVRRPGSRPTVLIVGEIYVRCVPFANDFVIEKLEQRGCRTRLAPFNEWLEYVDHINRQEGRQRDLSSRLSSWVERRIRQSAYATMARGLGWPPRPRVSDALRAAADYLREDVRGEAILTLGSAVEEWRHGRIDAVVSVGPLECMPNKIAEAQFFHVAEREGLLVLTLPMTGEPANADVLDNFVFEVRARHESRRPGEAGQVIRATSVGRTPERPWAGGACPSGQRPACGREAPRLDALGHARNPCCDPGAGG